MIDMIPQRAGLRIWSGSRGAPAMQMKPLPTALPFLPAGIVPIPAGKVELVRGTRLLPQPASMVQGWMARRHGMHR
ncbi:MAG TPA: hypothetical protein VF422_11575 [Dokdonella sp.]